MVRHRAGLAMLQEHRRAEEQAQVRRMVAGVRHMAAEEAHRMDRERNLQHESSWWGNGGLCGAKAEQEGLGREASALKPAQARIPAPLLMVGPLRAYLVLAVPAGTPLEGHSIHRLAREAG